MENNENLNISLEKIELVKDRTGVSYREAKDALEKTGGSVIDAIISIEDEVDSAGKIGEKANGVLELIKSCIHKGNISKLLIKKGDEVILNLPVNAGIIGTVLFPWAIVAGAIAAFGTRCSIQLVKDDGDIIDVSEKAGSTFDSVVSKGGVVVDEIVDKSQDIYTAVKDKSADIIENIKEKKAAGNEGLDMSDLELGEDVLPKDDK